MRPRARHLSTRPARLRDGRRASHADARARCVDRFASCSTRNPRARRALQLPRFGQSDPHRRHTRVALGRDARGRRGRRPTRAGARRRATAASSCCAPRAYATRCSRRARERRRGGAGGAVGRRGARVGDDGRRGDRARRRARDRGRRASPARRHVEAVTLVGEQNTARAEVERIENADRRRRAGARLPAPARVGERRAARARALDVPRARRPASRRIGVIAEPVVACARGAARPARGPLRDARDRRARWAYVSSRTRRARCARVDKWRARRAPRRRRREPLIKRDALLAPRRRTADDCGPHLAGRCACRGRQGAQPRRPPRRARPALAARAAGRGARRATATPRVYTTAGAGLQGDGASRRGTRCELVRRARAAGARARR